MRRIMREEMIDYKAKISDRDSQEFI